MIDFVYAFPRTDLDKGESFTLSLKISYPIMMKYLRPSSIGIDDVWVEDIRVGERSLLLSESRNNQTYGLPLLTFFEATLLFDVYVPTKVPIQVKVMNCGKRKCTVALSLFAEHVKYD